MRERPKYEFHSLPGSEWSKCERDDEDVSEWFEVDHLMSCLMVFIALEMAVPIRCRSAPRLKPEANKAQQATGRGVVSHSDLWFFMSHTLRFRFPSPPRA